MTDDTGTGSANGDAATSSALAGKVQAEKTGYASELVAYRVVSNLANEIAKAVSTTLKKHSGEEAAPKGEDGSGENEACQVVRVLLVDSLDYAGGGTALAEVKAQTSLIETVFKERRHEHDELLGRGGGVPTEEGGPGLAALGLLPALAPLVPLLAGAGKAVLDMPQYADAIARTLAYFRSDHQVAGREMEVGHQALLFSTAGALADAGAEVYVPGFYANESSELLSKLASLAGEAARLKTERDALAALLPKPPKPDPTGAASGPPAGSTSGTTPDEGSVEDGESSGEGGIDKDLAGKIARAIVETDAALLLHESYRAAWTAPPKAAAPTSQPAAQPSTQSTAQASPPALATAAPAASQVSDPGPQRPVLDRALAQERLDALGITHLLVLSAFTSGGDSTVRDRLWREDRLGFMGGAAVGYMLAGKNGAILDADTLPQFAVTGGTLQSYTKGEDFEDIDFKPDRPGRLQ